MKGIMIENGRLILLLIAHLHLVSSVSDESRISAQYFIDSVEIHADDP
jgi:hypothetical protein